MRCAAVRKRIIIFLGAIGFAMSAHAFPEMVRHGYVNCVACHVSPNGGGVLTDYGRSLSKELLSTWGREGEERPFYVVNQPEWLKLGGDYRTVQTYLNDPRQRDAKYFTMQTDVEAAVNVWRLWFVGAAGTVGGPSGTPNEGQFISREHYVLLNVADEFSLRTGKFRPEYGINNPNHTISTRRPLGFDEGTESYNVEAAYLGEKENLYITGLMGRVDTPNIETETGVAISASHTFHDKYKLGVSYLKGRTGFLDRQLAGVWGILGFTKFLYFLTEFDQQWTNSKSQLETRGAYFYNQLAMEVYKGLHIYLMEQVSYSNLNSVLSRNDGWGPGIKFYPRPHFEFQAELRRDHSQSSGNAYNDVGFILFHYYL